MGAVILRKYKNAIIGNFKQHQRCIYNGERKLASNDWLCIYLYVCLPFFPFILPVSNCGTNWHVAEASIASPYRAFSKEKIFANIGVHIGLDSANITLRGIDRLLFLLLL